MNRRFTTAVGGVAILGCAILSAASTPTIKSQSLSDATRVDGKSNDWETLIAVTKELSVAAANDADRLTLAIASSDPQVKQRLQLAGVIVYLDPNGKKGESFGVRIPPLGGTPDRGRSGGDPGGGRRGSASSSAPAPQPPGGVPERGPSVTYVEVIGPAANERHIVDLAQARGFEVASGDNLGTLFIELTIPLRTNGNISYAPQLIPGKSIVGIGFVTPDPPHIGGPPSGGPGGGGGGGMPSGRGGMGGGMPGGGSGPPGGAESQGKSLKIWTTLTLLSLQ
jgi:hypothetical protein